MPYPRTSSGYSTRLRELVEAVAASNVPHSIECDSEKQARGLRGQYYQYLAAVKRDCTHPPAWMTEAEMRDLKDFLRRFMAVQFVVDGPRFIVRPRDEAPMAKLLDRAKADEPLAPEQSPATDASIASLLEKINAKK